MATLALHFKSEKFLHRATPNLTFSHLFSSSTSQNPSNGEITQDTDSQSTQTSSPSPPSSPSPSSFFSDIKARLKQQQSQQQEQQQQRSIPPQPFSFTSLVNQPRKHVSIEEVRNRLSRFRTPSSPTSFQEMYKRNAANRGELSGGAGGNVGGEGWLNRPGDKPSFDLIKNSLKRMKAKEEVESFSLDKFKNLLSLRPKEEGGSHPVIGGVKTGNLPPSVFGKELKEREKMEEEEDEKMLKSRFFRAYDHKDLGEKLKLLRPVGKKAGENWFSLSELNERLERLRVMEEKEEEARAASGAASGLMTSLKRSLEKSLTQQQNSNKGNAQPVDILGQMGSTPRFKLLPPQEHLVEKYFHPDNMSSAEKLKIELKKVRDEFKMSESDCGSTRVQIALLTTEIKHLSAVLHKKDKHSRRGLLAKVQRRKTLLKYLRRTDWDSYCLVVSRFGLRDNPGYKELAR
ncbi:hypothetical protein Dimus_027865 [Dionaea muscipula]